MRLHEVINSGEIGHRGSQNTARPLGRGYCSPSCQAYVESAAGSRVILHSDSTGDLTPQLPWHTLETAPSQKESRPSRAIAAAYSINAGSREVERIKGSCKAGNERRGKSEGERGERRERV